MQEQLVSRPNCSLNKSSFKGSGEIPNPNVEIRRQFVVPNQKAGSGSVAAARSNDLRRAVAVNDSSKRGVLNLIESV